MKKLILPIIFLISLTSCSIVTEIFKAGVWVGIALVVLAVLLMIGLSKK